MLYISTLIWHQSFLHPSIKIWLEGEGRSVFLSEILWWLLWWFICHSKEARGAVYLEWSDKQINSQIKRIWIHWAQGGDVFLEGSFILSCVLGLISELQIIIFYETGSVLLVVIRGQGWSGGEDQGVGSVVGQVQENWRCARGQAWIRGSRIQS